MELRIIDHRSEKVERMQVDVEDDGHAGGDLILAESFLDLVKGRAKPNASLRDGLSAPPCASPPASRPEPCPSSRCSAKATLCKRDVPSCSHRQRLWLKWKSCYTW